MKLEVKQAFQAEMDAARQQLQSGDLAQAFIHLERAHVLGQRYVVPHVKVHWRMLRIGLERRSGAEVWGQAIRILLGAIGSAINAVPVGNTGGTNINLFARLPIEPELQRVLGDK